MDRLELRLEYFNKLINSKVLHDMFWEDAKPILDAWEKLLGEVNENIKN